MRTGTTAVAAHASCLLEQRALLLRKAVLGAATAAALLTFAQQRASAASVTWTGATDVTWATPGNWIGGVPANTDDAIFYDATANTANLSIDLGAARTVKTLQFNTNATSQVTLNVSTTNILTLGTGTATGDVVVSAGSHRILSNSLGATGTGNAAAVEIKMSGSTVFNVATGASLDLVGHLVQGASSNTFTKNGGGTLSISSDNANGTSFNMNAGGFIVNAGTLQFNHHRAMGNTANAVTVNNGGTLEFTWTEGGNYNSTNGNITLANGATLRNAGNITGGRTLPNGTGAIVLSGGTATIDVPGTSTFTVAQELTGAGGFTKTGTGVLVLNATTTSPNVNSYAGTTTVSAGTLRLGASATFGNSPLVNVQSGGVLDVTNQTGAAMNANLTLGGTGHVLGAATLSAGTLAPGLVGTAGTMTFDTSLTLSGANLALDLSDPSSTNDQIAVTGALSVPASTVVNVNRVAGTLTPGTYTIATYGSLGSSTTDVQTNLVLPQVRQGMSLVDPATTPGSLQVLVGAGSAASLVWTGSASSTWDRAANNFTNGGSPDHFYDWDNVTFDDSSSVNAVDVGSLVTPNNVTFNNNAKNYTLSGSGTLNAVQTLTKSGTGTLTISNSGVNSISSLVVSGGQLVLDNSTAYVIGSTTNGGTIQIGTGATTGSIGNGPVVNNGTLAFNRSDAVTAPNAISGSGNVEVNGSGTVTLTGANSYTGTTTVNSGTLKVTAGASTGDTNGAAITVKSGATFDIGGNTTANNYNLGAKTIRIAGNGVGGTAGAITNSGTVTQNAAFNNITLDADALITGGRMDIGRATAVTSRTLDLAGHTLTTSMTGTQPIFSILDGVTVTAGDIVVNGTGSALGIERSLTLDNIGGTITFNTGTVLQGFQTASGAVKRPMVFKGGNTIGSGNTAIAVINSNMTLDGSVTLQAVASGVPGTANNPLQLAGNISGVGGVTKVGTNSVTLSGTNTYAGATAVNGGTLVLSGSNIGSASLTVADGATVQVTNGGTTTDQYGGLNLNSSGKFDIDGAKVVFGGGTASSTVLAYLQRGYASGAWTGTGLTSTGAQAAADPKRVKAIGWTVAGDAGLTAWGSVTGLAATDIVAKLTTYGDLNLDDKVDGSDYTLIDRYVAINGLGTTTTARWIDGDANYDGTVNAADFLLMDTALGVQNGVLSPDLLATRQAEFGDAYVSQLVAAVPEPASVGVVAAAGSLLALRRRRK